MSMSRVGFSLLLIALTFAATTAAWSRSLQEVLNTGSLRVGVSLFTPWAARDGGGNLIGFEVDVAKQVAADMGVKSVLLVYDFDRLIPALESGEIDLIAAGLTITPDRALHVNFSQPYAQSGLSLVTHLQSTAQIQRLEDLDDPMYKLAAVEDSVAVDLAQRLLPRIQLQLFDSAQSASEALLTGKVNAYLEDEPIPTFLALENPSTLDLPLAQPLLAGRVAFAVNKGDPDFLAFLNAWITAREADTWLPTTNSYWFKSLRWKQRVENGSNR